MSLTVFIFCSRLRSGITVVKLQYDNNKQYKLTLPKALIDAKGWTKGTEVKVVLDDEGNIVLKVESKGEGRK